MPIYEYKCVNCGTVKEVMHKISESPVVKCPECSGDMSKLISAAAFHLKGSGWYVTDYKNKGKEGSGKGKAESTASKKETPTKEPCKSCKAKAVNE